MSAHVLADNPTVEQIDARERLVDKLIENRYVMARIGRHVKVQVTRVAD